MDLQQKSQQHYFDYRSRLQEKGRIQKMSESHISRREKNQKEDFLFLFF